MKKRLTVLLLSTMSIFFSSVHTFADFDPDTKVFVNGKPVSLDNPVFFDDYNYEIYLPLRQFLEINGYIITYDAVEKTIYGTDRKNTFSLTIGADSFKVNGQVYTDKASPSKIKNGNTYISDFTVSRILNSSAVFIPGDNVIDFIKVNDSYSYDYTSSNYLPDDDINAVNTRLIANLKDFDDSSADEAKQLIFDYITSDKYTNENKTAEYQTPELLKKTQERKESYVKKITDLFKKNNRLIYSETSVKNCIDFLKNSVSIDENSLKLYLSFSQISSAFENKSSKELDEIKFDVLSYFIDYYRYYENNTDKIFENFKVCYKKLTDFAKKNNIFLFDYSEYIKILKELAVIVLENPSASDKIIPDTFFYTYVEAPFKNTNITSQADFDNYVKQTKVYLDNIKTYIVSKETPPLDKSQYYVTERELSNIYMRLEDIYKNTNVKGKTEYEALSAEISEYIKTISRNSQRLDTQEKIDEATEKLKKYIEKLKEFSDKYKL